MADHDTSTKTDVGTAPPLDTSTADPIGDESKPAVAASRTAPEPAAPDGSRAAGPRPASGEPGRHEAPNGVPEVPGRVGFDIGAYRLWGLIALAILILVLLIAM